MAGFYDGSGELCEKNNGVHDGTKNFIMEVEEKGFHLLRWEDC